MNYDNPYYVAIWFPVQGKFEILINASTLDEAEILQEAYTETYPNNAIIILKMVKGVLE